jgi:hypothetical protein
MFNFGMIQPTPTHNAFSHGAYACNGQLNGMQAMIMQSQESADNVIKSFEQYLSAGFGTEAALTQAYMANNVSENDLTDFDKERIKRKVEDAAATNFGWGWR